MSMTTAERDRSVHELLEMDEATAKRELSWAEYQRWDSLNDHHERAEDNRQELNEADAEVHDLLVNNDPAALAVEVELWGNDVLAYYGAEDSAIQSAADRLSETFDVDADTDLDEVNADDIDDDQIREAKVALADLVCAAIVEWNGTRWDALSEAARESIRTQITAPRDEGGWGIMGLMDAWGEIQVAVESARDERLERVQKFRDPEWRGNR